MHSWMSDFGYTPFIASGKPLNPSMQNMNTSTQSQKSKIETTAQRILDARNLYPESSFADLYDEASMPLELRKAHRENDSAVCEAYGWPGDISEGDIVAELFLIYKELTE